MQVSPSLKKGPISEPAVEIPFGDFSYLKSCVCKSEDLSTKSIACVSSVNKDEQLNQCMHSTATYVDEGNLESSAAHSGVYGLYQHKETYTSEKPHKCSQCSAAFARASKLGDIILYIQVKKPHKCNQCSAAFSTTVRPQAT